MIDRTKGDAKQEENREVKDSAAGVGGRSQEKVFPVYGRGGRAWVERCWSASSLSFKFSSDQTRRP